jgi:hypothetical protein
MSERALTRKQVSALTGYSYKTLSNFAPRGKGPPCRQACGKILYLESEVQAWLKNLPLIGGESPAASRG